MKKLDGFKDAKENEEEVVAAIEKQSFMIFILVVIQDNSTFVSIADQSCESQRS